MFCLKTQWRGRRGVSWIPDPEVMYGQQTKSKQAQSVIVPDPLFCKFYSAGSAQRNVDPAGGSSISRGTLGIRAGQPFLRPAEEARPRPRRGSLRWVHTAEEGHVQPGLDHFCLRANDDLPPAYLQRFFNREGGRYYISINPFLLENEFFEIHIDSNAANGPHLQKWQERMYETGRGKDVEVLFRCNEDGEDQG